MIQVHPRNTKDPSTLAKWQEKKGEALPKIVLSKGSFEEAISIADQAFYYQTSTAPLFLLCGIPTLQVGHWPNADLLVAKRFCQSAVTPGEFVERFPTEVEIDQGALFEELGICEDWPQRLYNALLEKNLP